ncbi:rab GTPase-binding effector protein 2-like [Scleropages formosus]|uniref:Rab GTPase-binding effector protein 2 n=1 Tax=Scleropages formosus TaxID=113540 RepID=A0A0P7UUD6_SCLFO|nr:rab GTPase-binding effector protein 2-like [Scleropages formosus]
MQGAHAQCMEADAQVEAPVCGVSKAEVVVTSLQAELADCRAQVEHWQGVATICEMSKQEELAELQRRCDQEVESLQEALRETASQYEARISALQAECSLWRKGGGSIPPSKVFPHVQQEKATAHPDGCADGRPEGRDGDAGEGTDEEPGSQMGENGDNEGGLSLTEGYFARHCDTTSLSSFSLDTPSLPRRPPPQEDTASLVSTGTLVPEAIYLPPPGHRLVTLSDWDALHTQLAELQAELARVREERAELERELGTQSSETQRQVTMLQSQVQNSEALLQDLQKSFAQSQNAVQRRLAELSLSHRKVCSKLSRLKGGEAAVGAVAEDERVQPTDVSLALQVLLCASWFMYAGVHHRILQEKLLRCSNKSRFRTSCNAVPRLQGAHCEERLRIEIVNLREQLEQRTEESVRLSSLKTETDRIQGQNEKLQQELQACRTELTGLQVALSHLQRDNKAQSSEKSLLEQQCLELRSQMISLRSQLDTSQAVQRDFVQLSQSLQVKMELIRQAESMDQVREVLEEGPSDDSSKVTDTL